MTVPDQTSRPPVTTPGTGAPMTGRILLSRPDVGPLEESYLLNALRSGWVAPAGPELERVRTRGRRAGRRRPRGGAGLRHRGASTWPCSPLGAGPRDVVVVPTLTFVATANAVSATRERNRSSSTATRRPATSIPICWASCSGSYARQGRRIAAVMPVDMFGPAPTTAGSCRSARRPECRWWRMPPRRSARSATGRPAGSFGRAAVVSFNGNKIITTSGGGMLLSDDAGTRRPLPLPVDPGPSAGGPLRAHRGRLQLPAEQPARRAGPGPAAPPGRHGGPAPAPAGALRQAVRRGTRAVGCSRDE